ncbi:MAG: PH domain-containing protein [Jatrophihabitantaceae bacterium]
MPPAPAAPPAPRTFRLPRSAYLLVLFLLFCVIPLALAADGSDGAKAIVGPRALLLIIPVAAAFFIARTATVVDDTGIRVRALLGSRLLRWDELRGLSVDARSVYAVCRDGSVRLPCVRVADLAAVAQASAGRLPPVAQAVPKSAPARRRRR